MMTSAVQPARSLTAILEGIATLPAQLDRQLDGIELDSRQVHPGALFMACQGLHADGRQFVDDAIKRGAQAVLAEAGEGWQGTTMRNAVPVVAVDNLPGKLAELAARFYAHPAQQLELIGVTGTNGKTSSCQLIAQLLSAIGKPCGQIGTLGFGMSGQAMVQDAQGPGTTPDAVSLQRQLATLLERGAEAVVMEVSSHGLEQQRVIVDDFRIAVFTNLTRDHLDYHGSMAAYGTSKRRLFTGTGLQLAVLNADDAFVINTRTALDAGVKVISWGLRNELADINAQQLEFHAGGMTLRLVTPWGKFTLNSLLLGEFNASNLLAATALVLASLADEPDFDPQGIINAASTLAPVTGRMQLLVHKAAPLTVVVDYAHTPDGLEKSLAAMRQHSAGKLWCVFGCGGERDRGKRPLMGALAEKYADHVVLTDDNPRGEASRQILADIAAGLKHPEVAVIQAQRASAIAYALRHAQAGDSILIAGKGHESYQEIAGVRQDFNDAEQALEVLGQLYPEVEQ